MIDIQSIVFSRIKHTFPSEVKANFPDLFFTTNDRTSDDPKFPSVYVHELPGIERGQTLEGNEICAVLSTFEIRVSDNENMENVTAVMNAVVDIMKSMRFEVVSMPEFRNTSSLYIKVARFRRMVGMGDTL